MIVNNVDLEKVLKTVQNGVKDKSTLIKPVKMQGTWNFDPQKGYQFSTELGFEKGKQTVEIDSPSFLGGSGNRLGPMAYCVAGITSCFVGTFVGIAASQGIKLTRLAVNTECGVNFAKTLDVADEPISQGIKFEIDADAENADKAKLQEIIHMAEERCPAVYSMTHSINVDAKIK